MATFIYRALDSGGNPKHGSGSFPNEQACTKYLDKRNLAVIGVYKSETVFKSGNYKIAGVKELAIFCRQMSVLFFSDITLMEGVMLIAEQTENRQLKLALKEIYKYMSEAVTFAEAMGMYPHIFGSYLLNMIQIGETSGTLDITFQNVGQYFEKDSKIRKKLKSAITYPAVLTIMMFAVIVLLITKIIPVFDGILKSMAQEIPPITGGLLGVSLFLSKYGPIILGVIALVVILLFLYSKTEKGKKTFDKLKIKTPLSRYISTRIITARFARSLATLIKSGVSLINSLDEVKTLVDNEYLEPKFDEAIAKIKEGDKLDEVLTKIGIFPPLFIKMLIIGQTTGHLDEMLDRAADLFDEDIDEAIERLTLLIEPVLIIILSVVVGIILVSVMLPMIGIMNSLV